MCDVQSYFLLSPQIGRWSALYFSAENGDSATTYALIKAGANIHLKHNVWDSHVYMCTWAVAIKE